MLNYRIIPTKLSSIPYLVVVATPRGLCYIQPATTAEKGLIELRQWINRCASIQIIQSHTKPHKILDQACEELKQYLDGKIREFQTPLDLEIAGTPFQRRVWGILQTLKYGTTCTYADIAELLGTPKSYRAVGNANGQNPICIVVPCHRVVSQKGVGGYSGGIAMKTALLELERKK